MTPVIDGGWAWLVLLGVHVSIMLSNGYLTTLGIFYNDWKDYFETSATASSLLISLPWLVASPLSFFVGILASRVGVRWVSMAGAAVNGLATIVGSFTTDIRQLYVCNAMAGAGAVMVISPGTIILARYFDKRYVFANGIAVLGLNIGQMVFPPLIRLFSSSFGWRGAMFLIGALQMNGVAACALFRPLKTTPDTEFSAQERDQTNEISSYGAVTGRHDTEPEEMPDCPSQKDRDAIHKLLTFLKIFTNSQAMLVLLVNCSQSMCVLMNLTHMPARAKEAGWSDTQSAMLVLAFGVTSSITRVAHGWFVDRHYVSPFKLQLVTLIGIAVTTSMNPVSDCYAFLVGDAAVFGAFVGVGTPLLIANIRTVVSASELPAALSLMWATFYLFAGLGSITAGTIFDATGNYVAPFLTGGAISLVSFLLFALVTIIKRRQDTRHQKLQSTSISKGQIDTAIKVQECSEHKHVFLSKK